MKWVISVFLFLIFSYANSSVVIYKSTTTLLGLEKSGQRDLISSTLLGGSIESGSSSPADCVVKFKLKKIPEGFSASLLPFYSDTMGYSEKEQDSVLFEINRSDRSHIMLISEGLDVCPIGSNFSGDYEVIYKNVFGYNDYFDELIKVNYFNALRFFKVHNVSSAVNSLEPYMVESLVNNYYNVDIYNDYGFFLQQNNMPDEAVKYLTVVINRSPGRIPAYLNLADSYWDAGNRAEAKVKYKKYVELMQGLGQSKKIPQRAIDRTL
ncbi:tetratricopeptide repeat protein [Buttiauxella sp. 3AFRM03]|uniref:tetratricopeptide repeat protein n=1 Tax=Buttiauxella sp. 3AFRM03 TaxID=2479367 RepID=UPI000EF79A8D|nr:tetratricopeptide repeat protein [Buttiauxella sp. 3AFRM03]AYN28456.1 tetratricopeptide repeat protein [Buttiauxella sp. 3AFRM03]